MFPHVKRRGLAAALATLAMVLSLSEPAAASCLHADLTASSGTLQYNPGAHGSTIGTSIGTVSAGGLVLNCSGSIIQMNSGVAFSGKSQVPGVRYHYLNMDHAVFSTPIPGVGYAITAADWNIPRYRAITDHWVETYAGAYVKTLGFRYIIHFVTTGDVAPGTHRLSNFRAASMHAGTVPLSPMPIPELLLNATFVVKAETCTLTNTVVHDTLTLPPVTSHDFDRVPVGGNTSHNSHVYAAELKCPAGVSVWASVSDGANPANTSRVLTPLAGAHAASGVGVQLFSVTNHTSPLQFGPDTTSDRTGAWHVGTAPAGGSTERINLFARYVRTAQTLRGGDVKAVATVTFSYR